MKIHFKDLQSIETIALIEGLKYSIHRHPLISLPLYDFELEDHSHWHLPIPSDSFSSSNIRAGDTEHTVAIFSIHKKNMLEVASFSLQLFFRMSDASFLLSYHLKYSIAALFFVP